MLSFDDIDKIARKVIEMQKQEGVKLTNSRCSIADITDKYHRKMYEKYGPTGVIEGAIRTIATYKVGARAMYQIPESKFEECRLYAEKLYKDLLEVKDE